MWQTTDWRDQGSQPAWIGGTPTVRAMHPEPSCEPPHTAFERRPSRSMAAVQQLWVWEELPSFLVAGQTRNTQRGK